jgi:hypothetical protein
MKIHVEVVDITGRLHVGNSSEYAEDELADLHEFVKHIAKMNNFNLETGNGKVHFNPAHIVTATVVREEE